MLILDGSIQNPRKNQRRLCHPQIGESIIKKGKREGADREQFIRPSSLKHVR